MEQGRDYASKLGCAFTECSAKTGEGIEKAAYDLVRRIVTYRDNERIRYEEIQTKAVKEREKRASKRSLIRRIFK